MFGKNVRRVAAALVGLGIVGLIVWALMPQPVPVDLATIRTGPLEVTVEDEGVTRIREVYTVSAPIGGEMLRTSLEVGDDVTAGQTIASIQPTDPTLLDVRTQRVNEAAVQAAQAAVDLAEAQIKQARAQLEFTRNDLRRAEELAASRTISARALEKAKLDVDSADAAVASAIATLEVRKRELESARARLIQPGAAPSPSGACCVAVRSPIKGRVLKIIAESEQVVPAGAPLIELGDPHDLEIAVDFQSRDAVRIKPGDIARIESWGGDVTLGARVKRIEPTGFTKVSALGIEEQRVKVVLDFTGPDTAWQLLGHGYRVIARVAIWRGEGLLVPLGALFRQGDSWAVFVASNGRAERRPVSIAERNLNAARVVEGLKVGEQVVLHPGDRVTDGARIVLRD